MAGRCPAITSATTLAPRLWRITWITTSSFWNTQFPFSACESKDRSGRRSIPSLNQELRGHVKRFVDPSQRAQTDTGDEQILAVGSLYYRSSGSVYKRLV